MSTNLWQPEPDEPTPESTQEEREVGAEYHAKARLVLEGSESQDWGLVKDCLGNVNFVPENAEVVGTWHKHGEGTIWVGLTTSINALSDRAIQLLKELAEKRYGQPAKPRVARQPTFKPPTAVTPEFTQEDVDIAEKLSRLRKLTGK